MNTLIRMVLSSLIGTFGFGLLIHAPKRSWLPASVLGSFTFALYWALTRIGLSDPGSLFLASLAGSMIALLLARKLKMIGTVFLMLSIVSFVPGLGLYRAMQYLGSGQTRLGADQLTSAMITIAMIALGQGAGSFLARAIHPGKH